MWPGPATSTPTCCPSRAGPRPRTPRHPGHPIQPRLLGQESRSWRKLRCTAAERLETADARLYSTQVQQRAHIRADHRGPLWTDGCLLTCAYAAVRVQVPVSGGQGVAGSNPAVPTVFRTLLRDVQQQYSSTQGRLLGDDGGCHVSVAVRLDGRRTDLQRLRQLAPMLAGKAEALLPGAARR
jgi:hypothetical protein